MNDLFETRETLLKKLHENDQAYLIFYYRRQKKSFVLCYIKHYLNLDATSTQRDENTHSDTKKHVNRHTSISQSISRIKENVERQKHDYESKLKKQKTIERSVMTTNSIGLF